MHEYDPTAGAVNTPGGPGKFIKYENGKVIVEMDYTYAVKFDAEKCFIYGGEKENAGN